MRARAKASDHHVTVVDDRGFARAECSCGWQGAGYRVRESARREAREHVLKQRWASD